MATKQKRMMLKVFIIVLLLSVFSEYSYSLGIGPSRQILSFVPGETIEGEFIIINDNAQEFKAAIYADGELSNYITLGQQLLEFTSKDTMKSVPYKITFPANAPKPGPNKIDIVVRQFPISSEKESTVSATVAVISNIIIKVPYPGKYAEGKLFISGTESGEGPARFLVTLYNFGTEDIKSAHARVEITGPMLGKISEFNTNDVSVKSKQEVNLEALWTPAVKKGTYNAIVTVFYDDKQLVIEQPFDLGTFMIEVSDIGVKKFTLGDVAKFDILLKNTWNTEIKDVYAEMTIEDSTGKKMTEFKTAAISIPPDYTSTLEGYWYTEGVMPGIYKVKLLVHYAGKMTEKQYEFEVGTNSFTRIGGIGAAVTEEQQEAVSTQKLLIILILVVIVILLIMNMVWFYFLTKQMRKGGDK